MIIYLVIFVMAFHGMTILKHFEKSISNHSKIYIWISYIIIREKKNFYKQFLKNYNDVIRLQTL